MAKKKNNAFTIVELLVAMTLLVILLGLSGMVFTTTVEAHRTAGASIDVSRNLRAITEQLSNDLRGLRKDAPLTIWFEQDADGQRYDQIQFFADGDFQSTKQYDTNGDGIDDTTIYGNVARVYYGHAWQVDYNVFMPGFLRKGYRPSIAYTDGIDREASNILARRIHISTNNASLDTALTQFPINTATNLYHANFGPFFNNYVEYDNYATLTLWKQLLTNQANCNFYLDTCFSNTYDLTDIMPFMQSVGRSAVDMNSNMFLHTLLAQGVVQMQVQWAYTVDDLTKTLGLSDPVLPTDAAYFTGVRWWPSADPDGDGNPVDSDFNTMAGSQGGAYFNMPGGTTVAGWYSIGNCSTRGVSFKSTFYPAALKFTLTLKDSNGIFAGGKTFTHIVYLDN